MNAALVNPTTDAPSTVKIETLGRQRRITIARVDKHNALSREVLAALAGAVSEVGNDATVNYVVVRGEGTRFFAAGGDLVDLATIRSDDETRAFAQSSRESLDAIRRCPLPVVAFVNGDALGGGAELAMACDMRAIASHARIGFIQSRLAITSAWGGGPDLCAAVGPSRAMRMMTRGEMVGAEEALAIGLADVAIDGDLDGGAAAAFFKPLDAAERHVLVAIKENIVACHASPTYATSRDVEQRNLVATWTHPAHWDAVDRIQSRPRDAHR